MPEPQELKGSSEVADRLWQGEKGRYPDGLPVLAIYAQPTAAEVADSLDPLVKTGRAQLLTPSSPPYWRGSGVKQHPIYPRFHVSGRALQPTHLFFKGVERDNPRNVIINFGCIWMKVQLLTHTFAQVYTTQDWDDAVLVAGPDGPKICIAFRFANYVLAFISPELLFEVHWAVTRDQLKEEHTDVLTSTNKLIEEIAAYLETRLTGRAESTTNLAIEIIRATSKTFGAIGVYTGIEVFARAGLNPALCEAEIFNSPSRVARLIEGFYSHAAEGFRWIQTEMPACFVGYTLAPTIAQRKRYASNLIVFGKEKAFLSERLFREVTAMEDVIKANRHLPSWERSPGTIFDAYEPTWSRLGFERKGNLGHLIFGTEQWSKLREQGAKNGFTFPKSDEDDALTQFFKRTTLQPTTIADMFSNRDVSDPFRRETFLRPGIYNAEGLILSNDRMKARMRDTILAYHWNPICREKEGKAIWTFMPLYPPNSKPSRIFKLLSQSQRKKQEKQKVPPTPIYLPAPKKDVVFRISTTTEKKKSLFDYLIDDTNQVSIGPLEYNGLAMRVPKQGSPGEWIYLACRNDRRVASGFYADRVETMRAQKKWEENEAVELAKNPRLPIPRLDGRPSNKALTEKEQGLRLKRTEHDKEKKRKFMEGVLGAEFLERQKGRNTGKENTELGPPPAKRRKSADDKLMEAHNIAGAGSGTGRGGRSSRRGTSLHKLSA